MPFGKHQYRLDEGEDEGVSEYSGEFEEQAGSVGLSCCIAGL